MSFLSYFRYKKFYSNVENNTFDNIKKIYKGYDIHFKYNKTSGLYYLEVSKNENWLRGEYIIPFLPTFQNILYFNKCFKQLLRSIEYNYTYHQPFKEFSISPYFSLRTQDYESLEWKIKGLLDVLNAFLHRYIVQKWEDENTTDYKIFCIRNVKNKIPITEQKIYNILLDLFENRSTDFDDFIELWDIVGYTKDILKKFNVENYFSSRDRNIILNCWIKVLLNDTTDLKGIISKTEQYFSDNRAEREQQFHSFIKDFTSIEGADIVASFKEIPTFEDWLETADREYRMLKDDDDEIDFNLN